jgi:hypothetical protein
MSRRNKDANSPSLKTSGYSAIISYSAFDGTYPPPNQPLPNYLHTCFHIEKECIEAGFAVNNVNLPFLTMCDQCKRYKEAINIGNKHVKNKNHNGHVEPNLGVFG